MKLFLTMLWPSLRAAAAKPFMTDGLTDSLYLSKKPDGWRVNPRSPLCIKEKQQISKHTTDKQ